MLTLPGGSDVSFLVHPILFLHSILRTSVRSDLAVSTHPC